MSGRPRRRRQPAPSSQLGLLDAPRYESAAAALSDVIEVAAVFTGRRGEWAALQARVNVALPFIGYDPRALDALREAVAPAGSLWGRSGRTDAARWQVVRWEGESCCLRSDGGTNDRRHGRDLILGATWRRIN